MKIIQSREGTFIGLTKKDIEKYANILMQKYNVTIKEIEAKYIGGCILENANQGIFVDNTLLNFIEEKMK